MEENGGAFVWLSATQTRVPIDFAVTRIRLNGTRWVALADDGRILFGNVADGISDHAATVMSTDGFVQEIAILQDTDFVAYDKGNEETFIQDMHSEAACGRVDGNIEWSFATGDRFLIRNGNGLLAWVSVSSDCKITHSSVAIDTFDSHINYRHADLGASFKGIVWPLQTFVPRSPEAARTLGPGYMAVLCTPPAK